MYIIYSCLQFADLETVWTIINETLLETIDLFVPRVRHRTKQYLTHSLFTKQTVSIR